MSAQQFERFGKYLLLEKLATGGMAEVFLARSSGTSGIAKFFAIKRILPQYAESQEFIDMFKDEAKIAINLNHSNIVSIHEFGVENLQFFLVMDYVEGRNMRQILNKMKKTAVQFSIDQIAYMVKEIAAGLDHAHRCLDSNTGKPLNITHRDMSPQNVMVSFEGEVKIVDFGIAKAESQVENTRAGTLKGKFGYMSPEQAEGQPIDLRTDIFSLGIVLWELLANDRLFSANNELNTLRKIRDCQIPSLRKLNPNIHAELERITQKALARDKNLRYQTAAAFHRDLNRFLNRQYPDFSPQDFSVFIKSIFAEDIMSLRKRLVEYSKVAFVSASSSEERTSVTETETNSLIGTETGPQGFRLNGETASLKDLISVTATPSASATTNTNSNSIVSEKSMEMAPPEPLGPVPNVDVSVPITTPGKSVLDAQSLQVASFKSPQSLSELRVELDEPSYRSSSRASSARRHTQSKIRKRKAQSSVRFTTIALFLISAIGVYSYLAKYYTNSMMPVIRMTDPLLGGLHDILGVNGTATQGSTKPAAVENFTPPPAEEVPRVEPPRPVPVAPPAPEAVPAQPAFVVITSQPSGAEIFIDRKYTGLITPSRVAVPQDRPFSLQLKRQGFVDYFRNDVSVSQLGSQFTARLQETQLAHIDVDLIPPKNARLYINGVLSPELPPFRNLAIPANVPVRLRVDDDRGNTDEAIVQLNRNQRKRVVLFPHNRNQGN